VGRYLVVVLGLAAWLGALLVVLRLRATRFVPVVVPADAGVATRVAAATARVTGAFAGGLVAGALVLGLGGRLMMRVLAATSEDAAQGRLTDAEEIVGEVTAGGTIAVVVFVGLSGGAIGAALYGLLRRWLPARSLVAGLVAGGIGAGALARPSGLVDPDNHDFVVLDPSWLAVALCVGLIVTFALLGAVLMDRWAATWPLPRRSTAGIAGLLPLVPALVFPPAALGVVAAIGARAAWMSTGRPMGRVERGLRALVVVAGGAGAAWTLLAAGEILTA
jgi:hypothetical protein